MEIINMNVVSLVLILLVVGGLVLFMIKEQFSDADFHHSLVGVWFNEHLNMRILLYDVDSVFQGSVVWADGLHNSILGTRVVENLKVGFFKICKGTYVDPITSKEYDIKVQLKGKTVMKLTAFDKETHIEVFSQEWKLLKS
ncbi:MAG: hypothetical protein JNM78_00155 [Cyclobacteriaceae bacterium]|nr:hypothetical protein [Cyclobacteriaceae bacterium]